MEKPIDTLRVVAVAVVIYLALGAFVLFSSRENVQGLRGNVWNMKDRATEVLTRLESQAAVALADRQDLIAAIVAGRQAMDAAEEANDVAALEEAERQTQLAINVIVEAYPDLSLTPVWVGLMDETAGSLNRIATARSNLITGQVSYNQMRGLFFPLMLVFPREEVLGEFSDPAEPLPTSSFAATALAP